MAREISNNDFRLSEDLPITVQKTTQFVTLLDLVSDGAEIEGFATPSKNSLDIPTSMLRPASPLSPEFTTTEEQQYIEFAQKDIFLDGRAIRTSGGVENIKNTSLALRAGTADQQIMLGVNELRLQGNVTPGEVKNNRDPEGNKVTGTLNAGTTLESTPRAAIITLTWPSLRQLSADDGVSVALGINAGNFAGENGNVLPRIRLRDAQGALLVSTQFQVNGISIGPFSRDYRIEIPSFLYLTSEARSLHYPITVEVLRDDIEFRANAATGRHPFNKDGVNLYEEGQRRFTSFSFTGLQGVIPLYAPPGAGLVHNQFPKTAYIGLRYSAEQFPNIPQRKYLIRGIKVKIPTGVTVDVADTGRIVYPTNYTFAVLTTTKHWTTDPAWILYALLTEDYGLNLDEEKIDKASFYAASLYCSDFASTGKPRYSFNGVIKTRKKALEIIREVAGLMRATLYYRNGSLKIALDKPQTANTVVSYLFTNANVVDGLFNYSGIEKDKKYTQVNVSYFNNSIQELDQVSIREQTAFAKFGLNQTNIQALYTTDRDQAIRLGRSIIYSSNFESEIVNFECGIEAACMLEPFMIIKIADKTRELIRASGRINSVTNSTTVVVDDATDTSIGIVGDTFLIVDKNGGVQSKFISAVSGSTVTFSTALDPLPQSNAVWAVKTGNVQHKKYRITNIKQKNNFIFNITAVIYDDNKYTYIDNFESDSFGLGDEPTSLLNPLISPEIQQLKEELVIVNNRAQSRIVLNFAHVDGARGYQIHYLHESGLSVVETIRSNEFVIPNNKVGNYLFLIRTVAPTFQLSESISTRGITAFGLTAPPSNVANLRSEEYENNLLLKWDRATDKDVLFGGKVRVKYALVTDGTANVGDANDLIELDGNSNEILISDYQSGEYFVTFVDVADNESVSATSVVVNRTISSKNLLAAQIRENTNNFPGTKTNLIYDSGIAGLRLTNGTIIDSLTDFDTLALADGTTFSAIDDVTSGVSSTGNYVFQNDIDLGATFRFHIEPHFKKSGFNSATLWDTYTDNIDTWPDILTSGTVVFNKSAELTFQVAKSTTGTASTSFGTFTKTDMEARTLSFKVLVNNDSSYENVDIEELGVNIIFRPRTERSIDNSSATNGVLTSSASGATTVTFNKKFFLGTSAVGGSTTAFKPVVNINVNNMQSGDFFTIDSVTSSNFAVSIKNGSSFVAREFTYSAFGYGEG
tara:strand:- start:1477 stop:5094 length:3618 start_codon:yes stop_codon:yes gene_type:complete